MHFCRVDYKDRMQPVSGAEAASLRELQNRVCLMAYATERSTMEKWHFRSEFLTWRPAQTLKCSWNWRFHHLRQLDIECSWYQTWSLLCLLHWCLLTKLWTAGSQAALFCRGHQECNGPIDNKQAASSRLDSGPHDSPVAQNHCRVSLCTSFWKAGGPSMNDDAFLLVCKDA